MTEESRVEAAQELSAAQNLGSEIFKEGTLINVTIGFWEGKVHQTEDDLTVTNSNFDSAVYTPGFKWLIPPKHTRPFGLFRSRLTSVMKRMSYKVPGMRGSRFVPKGAYPMIRQFLMEEKEAFFRERDRFIGVYPDLAEEQKNHFNAAYPEHAGLMDTLYPSAEQIASKFSYMWTPYSWSHTEIEEIACDAKAQLAERSKELVYQSSLQIRQHIIDATESVVNAIKNGKNTVNIKAVKAFSTRLDQLKHLNLFGDAEINRILKGASDSLHSIGSWKKETVDETDIESKLTDLVRQLKTEVETIESDPDAFIVSRRVIEAEDLEADFEPEVELVRRIDS